jgi:hypothetical protein
MSNKDKYLINREKFKKKLKKKKFFEIVDHWALYAGIKNLAKFLFLFDEIKKTFNLKGDIAELGSWKGTNVVFFAKILKIYSKIKKRVYCFDSFDGIKTFVEKDGKNINKYFGTYKGDLNELNEVIKLYNLERVLKIQKGLIQKTVPLFFKKNPKKLFSLVYYDADLYEPAKVMLDYFSSRMVKNGVIMFDEWNKKDFQGETMAVNEFLKKNKNFKKIIPKNTDQPSLVIKRIF